MRDIDGPKLTAIAVVLIMAAAVGYIIHTSWQAAQADQAYLAPASSGHVRQIDQALEETEAAMGWSGRR